MTKKTQAHAASKSAPQKTNAKQPAGATHKPRRGIRYAPDPGTIAHVDAGPLTGSFSPALPALVTEESYRGCGLVMTMNKRLQVGDKIRIKVGHGPVMPAEVRWRTELDSQVLRLGVMYL